MSFRDVIAAFWRRKWIIVSIIVLSAIVAAVYLSRLTPNYQSSTTLRMSPVASQALTTGVLATVPVDVDPSIVSTPSVTRTAAKDAREPAAALRGAATATMIPVTDVTQQTVSVQITASAPSAAAAQTRAKAFAAAYGTYLDGVVASSLQSLQSQKVKAEDSAAAYSRQVAADPGNQVASANLASAVSGLNAVNTAITTLEGAGPSAVVTTPAAAGASTNPRRSIVIALALLCGLIAGAGIALVRDRVDDRILSVDEIPALADTSALGSLSFDRKVAGHREHLPTATTLSEDIRSLRTSVQVLLPNGRGAVAVTSVEPGDGKTFLSANIALSWARAGRNVILVEGDLRRPAIAEYFPEALQGPGLSGLLRDAMDRSRVLGGGDIERALQETDHRGLRVLPQGTTEIEPADALASDGVDQIFRHLGRLADVVVIDTPPALAIADASVLAAHADGVVVLASARRSRRALISDTVETLTANGATVYGLVLNRVRARLPHSYSAYYLRTSTTPTRAGGPAAASSQEPARDDETAAGPTEDAAAPQTRSWLRARRASTTMLGPDVAGDGVPPAEPER